METPIMSEPISLEARRKRLMWRASRRGIKEMDLIVGGYAEAHAPGMSEADVAAFEVFLDIPDQDLLAYATGQADIPPERKSALLDAVLAFRPVTP
jgi:antitoxin CptB